jgi:pilus assembly protein Flp/PilA
VCGGPSGRCCWARRDPLPTGRLDHPADHPAELIIRIVRLPWLAKKAALLRADLRRFVKNCIYCADNLPLLRARIAGSHHAVFCMLSIQRRIEEQTSMSKIRKFFKSDLGATAIEYGLIAALIAVVIIAALQLTGNSLKDVFNNVGGTLGTTAN